MGGERPLWASSSLYAGGVATISQEAKRELLARAPLFSRLSPGQLDEMAASARIRRLAVKQELFHKGDEGSQVYAVASGRLKAFTTSSEGDDVVFDIIGPGELIGEIALLGGTPRTATVTALEPCELLVIDRREFLAFLERNPDAAVELLRVLAVRIKHLSELVEDTLFLNLPLRLAKKLTALCRIYGQPTADGVRVDLKLSQEEWGDLVGTTRESINKQLRQWTQEGFLRVDGGYIVILRPDALEELAGEPGVAPRIRAH